VIDRHAGYKFCGQTSAYAYKNIDPTGVKTVFVLGPSHHVYMDNQCALSQADIHETPIGNLKVNKNIQNDLVKENKNLFTVMKLSDEEAEHSLEMHLPFIAKTFDVNTIQIVPIIVGHLNSQTAKEVGKLLSVYMEDPQYFFAISSDFCHWGKRFGYTYYDETEGEIWESIKSLDLLGAEYIASLDVDGFESYLKKYKNTICGRNAISILLNAIVSRSQDEFRMKLVHYSQSSQCYDKNDSSVSYASLCLLQSQ
jgi:AmmeMemoRadiSam system protein B